MNLSSLRMLTWGTIAGSVASALLLAAGESGIPPSAPRAARTAPAAETPLLRLPAEATAAGRRPATPASGASH